MLKAHCHFFLCMLRIHPNCGQLWHFCATASRANAPSCLATDWYPGRQLLSTTARDLLQGQAYKAKPHQTIALSGKNSKPAIIDSRLHAPSSSIGARRLPCEARKRKGTSAMQRKALKLQTAKWNRRLLNVSTSTIILHRQRTSRILRWGPTTQNPITTEHSVFKALGRFL